MEEASVQTKQRNLESLLCSLSGDVLDPEDTEQLERISGTLYHIYRDGEQEPFRHYYSRFFPLLLDFTKADSPYNFEYLTNNLSILGNYISAHSVQYDLLLSHFFKLQDHINLEIARIQFSQSQTQQIQDLNSELTATKLELNQAKDSLKVAIEHAHGLKTEVLTVLSIFSAVVLAFMGGMSFSSSVLESMQNSSIYKVIFIATICGLVVFNTICGLMYFVSKITKLSILTQCNEHNCTCVNDTSQTNCSPLKRLKSRLPYVFYFNVFALIILSLDIIAWIINLHKVAYIIQNLIFHF
ncbi:hypothetical protein SAMN02745978_01051 [Butyricicoccus pullicaecorum DSM 23266]|uniref:Uncharacterized protein n=2 Tax=Butyricicoccus pullicaecorum TaxID=501571 RepID=R8W462_9FIRM|nr:hypothetical protein [Butyricicoccus pullicaecorum]EOQ39653.1 hypothetical protein HMPREF1526_00347 [Butyricicoccus pullicaecorum 1.2]SKA56910.1 hypothetical protein SAMN02745978_01051 [Butyricicoccus pullicaecorum DSM 23266]